MRRIWIVTTKRNGFMFKVLIRATEEKLREYIASELPEAVRYTGASQEEVSAAEDLGLLIYCY